MTDTVPIVSLQRTLRLLLIVYGSCMCAALLAGAALVAHVDPFSDCETIGYLYLACIVGAMVLFYLTMKHLRLISSYSKTGQLLRGNDDLLKLNKRNMWLHLLGVGLIAVLTIALTAGYANACDNIREVVSSDLNQKQASGNDYRERVDEKFEYDNQFWRYNDQINNAYGSFVTVRSINCRAIFTDPQIHQKLHETHISKYSAYFGYWYQQDLNDFDPRTQAVLTNALIEASLAGGWISVLLWVGSFIFMVVQRFYLMKEKREMDKLSLHGNMDGTLRKEEMSIISGYQPSFQRGGLRGSDRSLRSMKSQASRREVDDLAFAVHGINTPTPRLTSSYPNGTLNGSSMGMMPPYPGQGYPGNGYPGGQGNIYTPGPGQGYIPPQQGYIPPLPQQGFQYPMPGQNVYNPNGSMHSTPRTPRAFQRQIPQISVEDTDKSQVETEIM